MRHGCNFGPNSVCRGGPESFKPAADRLPKVRAQQWLDVARARRPQGADRRSQRLVPRRVQERAPRQNRFRTLIRTLDVRRQRALQRRVHDPLRPSGCDRTKRNHEQRPHKLLRKRAEERPRSRALDGVGSDGALAWRREPGTPRRTARRREERKTSGTQPTLRQGIRHHRPQRLSQTTPLFVAGHWFNEGPERSNAR